MLETRIDLSTVFSILAKKASTRLSQEPCFGVNVKLTRFGTVARYLCVSLERCSFWGRSVHAEDPFSFEIKLRVSAFKVVSRLVRLDFVLL